MAVIILLSPVIAMGQAAEAEVKAAFVLNFAKFIDWPESQRPTDQPFNFCFIGSDRYKKEIRKQIDGKTVKGLDSKASFLGYDDALEYCHLVFMRGLEPSQLAYIMESLEGLHVLAVGESEQFMRAGGAIRFFASQGKIRFEINPDAAKNHNLVISSKLLNLARIASNNNEPSK